MNWKNKKGDQNFGLKQLMTILISIGCILLLFWLSGKLYQITVGSNRNTQANEILKQIGDKINYLEKNETMVLAGPKGWFLEKRENNRICVVCNESLGGVCPRTYNPAQPTCVSIKTGTDVQILNNKIEIYITEIMFKKTVEGENERIVISEKE
jgi:hypothetical protein